MRLPSCSFLSFALQVVLVTCLRPDIRADTDRDGIVDINDNSADSRDKTIWSDKKGAIFLPNVGDKYMRCGTEDLRGNPLSNDEMISCHDASGHLLFAPEYIAPLRTVPMKDIPPNTTAHIYATPRAAYERVRIFYLEDLSKPNSTDSWRLVDKQLHLNSTQLGRGLVLGIDGREFVKETTIWDGHVTVKFDVYPEYGSEQHFSDAVALKVAPVLTHHHLQSVETLITTYANDTKPTQQKFVEQMDKARQNAGIKNPLLLFNQSEDIWAQDILEPAYASMPGPNGPVSIRIFLRSAQSTRTSGRQVMEQLRGPGIGAFQPSSSSGTGFAGTGYGYHTINSYGNVETIPPYRSKHGINYKAGRIIQGQHHGMLPSRSVRDLIFSNAVQSSLFLETGWLRVGHVDEFIQFLPYNNDLGWTIGIASPTEAFRLLQDAYDQGHQNISAFSFVPEANSNHTLPSKLNMTIGDALQNETFRQVNDYAQKWINTNLETVLAEVPLSREDVIHVPCLYMDHSTGGVYVNNDGLDYSWPPVLEGEHLVIAFYPAPINGVVVGDHYISPNPFGPIVGGKDIIADAVSKAYRRAGMNVTFVDDFFSHHVEEGDVHCGSNTLRQTDWVWWEREDEP